MSQPKICIIEWEDPISTYSWLGLREFKKQKPAYIISVGLLIDEDEDYVRMALDYDKGGGVNTGGIIPKRCILKRTELALPRGVWSKKDTAAVNPQYPVIPVEGGTQSD